MTRFQKFLRGALAALASAAFALPAFADIPASERQVLVDLYNSTQGASWTHHSGWLGAAGTECTWFGITCEAGNDHVTRVSLYDNHLVGTLPSLSGLTSLRYLDVGSNQLTGSIPPLSGLTLLGNFYADYNHLTGSIPSLSGLTSLQFFEVSGNQLSGSIPSLAGLTSLQYFYVQGNQLTGSIPSLAGLTSLHYFHVSANHLTGSIPSLAGLTSLEGFRVNGNRLTGTPPAVPSPSALLPGGSTLCPNQLSSPSPTDAEWDAATGVTPWWQDCIDPDFIFASGFE